MAHQHSLLQQKDSQSDQKSLSVITLLFDRVTLQPLGTFLKELLSTISNFVLVTEVKSLVLLVTHVTSKHESVTKSVSVCHPVHFVNSLQTAVQLSVFLQDMAETRCHYELLVQHTTRPRPVVSSSLT
jgi:hypothetical protein